MRPFPTRLDDDVYAALRVRSEATGQSMNALVNEVLGRFLGATGADEVPDESLPARDLLRTRAVQLGSLARSRRLVGDRMGSRRAKERLAQLAPLLGGAADVS